MTKVKEWIGKLPKKVYIGIGTVALIIFVALMIVLLIPGNVSKRNLKSAEKYYASGNYEKAVVNYTKAIEKNKYNLPAYKGKILSQMITSKEEAKETLLSVVDITEEILGQKNTDIQCLTDIFLFAPELLTEDPELLNSILRYGYDTIPESEDLKAPLYDSYIVLADNLVNSNPSDALITYETACDLGIADESVNGKIANAAALIINQCIAMDDYSKASDILSKYGEKYGLDVNTLNTSIETSRDLYETKISLLSDVYNVMEYYYNLIGKDFTEDSVKDSNNVLCGLLSVGWIDMMDLDGSEAAEKLANSQAQKAYIYAPDYTTGYTGIACGLYTYGDATVDAEGNTHTKYYFYFGNYENGVRSGYGYSFAKSKTDSYKGFEGYWKNDAPNGFGVEYISNYISKNDTAEYQRVTYGNFTNGIENGTMTTRIRLTDASEELFEGTYEAANGVAPEIPAVTEDYELLNEVPEGQRVIAVIPSVDKGYDIYNVIYEKESGLLSALGY